MRKLTPETSYGFAVINFALYVLGQPLDPWQQWLVIHAGELLPDGRPRFRKVLVLVARQNGKTHLLKILCLFWIFVDKWPMILTTSTNLDYAKEAWQAAVDDAQATPSLANRIPRKGGIRLANGEQTLRTTDKSRYKIGTASRRGGRSLSIDRLFKDEVREEHSWDSYNAAVNAMNARPHAQAFLISNQGDDKSVVLDSLRESAMDFIACGDGDPRLGLFEWSALPGATPVDVDALAAANPQLGRRVHHDDLIGPAAAAMKAGGEQLTGFLTEVMCIRVKNLDAAISETAWNACYVEGDLQEVRAGVALCLDVSIDQQHVTLVAAAALPDGRVRVEPVESWSGPKAVQDAYRALPALVRRIKPQAFGWLPGGPGAALVARLAARKNRAPWHPLSVTVEEIRGEVTAVCMGLASLVDAGQVIHARDPLIDAHVIGASKLWQQDVWRFQRRGAGHCDAAYATAGAAHIALLLPTPIGAPRVLGPRRVATS